MSGPLHTLLAPCSHSIDIRKSRFLAQATPVTTVAEALAFVHCVSTAEPGANHHCWAWRTGQDYRFNDDGEPAGTAGKPILQAIDGQGLDGVVVVVTRWFGGIKLGAGGLMRAYGGSAAECLRLAETAPIIAMQRLTLHIGFAELPLLKARMHAWQPVIQQEVFAADGVHLEISLPQAHVMALQVLLSDLTRGSAVARVMD